MPRQIPYHDLLFHVMRYLVRRQIAQRPTTLYQLSKRMGYGVDHIQGIFEIEKIKYVLIPHNENLSHQTTEILLQEIPESLVLELGISNNQVKESLEAVIERIEPIAQINLPDSEEKIRDLVDPDAKYRIQKRTFEILESNLLTEKEVERKLIRKGFPDQFFRLKFLEYRLYEQVSPIWRPYFYGKSTYFLKGCLKAAHELRQFLPEHLRSVARVKTFRYRRKKVQPENPHFFN